MKDQHQTLKDFGIIERMKTVEECMWENRTSKANGQKASTKLELHKTCDKEH